MVACRLCGLCSPLPVQSIPRIRTSDAARLSACPKLSAFEPGIAWHSWAPEPRARTLCSSPARLALKPVEGRDQHGCHDAAGPPVARLQGVLVRTKPEFCQAPDTFAATAPHSVKMQPQGPYFCSVCILNTGHTTQGECLDMQTLPAMPSWSLPVLCSLRVRHETCTITSRWF